MRVMGCVGCGGDGGTVAACQHQPMLQPPEIDRFSAIAPYVQIADIIEKQVRDGHREPGSRLPSIADIVGMWGVNRQTAAKALRLLRDRGLARMSPGMGWYVPERLPPVR